MMRPHTIRARYRLVAALLSAICLASISCSQPPSKAADGAPLIDSDKSHSQRFMRGAIITSWEAQGYLQSDMDNVLDQLQASHVDTVAVLVTWYQTDKNATLIAPSADKTPTHEAIRHLANKVSSRDMQLVLKPHVDLLDDEWRGTINMTTSDQWNDWFDSYDSFISTYAALAQDIEADMLVVGTELKLSVTQARWQQTIDNVRSAYGGAITYAANWDNVSAVSFWHKVDYVGVDAYWPAALSTTPDEQTAMQLHQARLDAVQTIASDHNIPILLTEFGYQDRNGTCRTPWWVDADATEDQAEQALCYRALLSAATDTPMVAGTFAWMTYREPSWNVDGFDFLGKPAADELAQTYRKLTP